MQYRIVDIPVKSLCMSKMKYTYFPDYLGFWDGVDLCRRFGGRMADMSTSAKVQSALNFLGKEIIENDKYDNSLIVNPNVPYTDEKDDTFFIHYETGLPPIDPLPWSNSQPNGGMVECCAHFGDIKKDTNGNFFSNIFDLSCTWPVPVLCEDVGEIVLEIRGM